MLKLKSNLLILFNILFLIIFALIINISIFNSSIFRKLNPVVILLGIVCLISLFILILLLFKNLNKTQFIILFIINLIFIILLQFFFVKYFRVKPSWDFGTIYSESIKISNGSTKLGPYFYEKYPNNSEMAIILGNIFKFIKPFNISPYCFAIFLNVCVINLSLIITWFFSAKLFNIKVAYIISLLSILITPLFTYAPIFYTDTLTMIFPILSFLFYYLYKIQNKGYFKYFYLIFIGLLLAFGTSLKTNIIISFIALLIFIIFINNSSKSILKEFFMILLIFFICISLINTNISKWLKMPIENAGIPATHWIMMGLKDKGGFNGDDVKLTLTKKTKDLQKDLNIKIIKQRLKNYGFNGYIKFLYKKLTYTWADGTMFAPVKLSRYPIFKFDFQKYIFKSKDNINSHYTVPFLYVSQISFSTMLIFIFLGSISLFKRSNKFGYLFNICIFGVFSFLIIWETRSRYLVCILPILLMSASIGIDFLINKFKLYNKNDSIL